VIGKQGRRHRKLLDNLKERRGYFHLKKEAPDHTMWTPHLRRGFGPVMRQMGHSMSSEPNVRHSDPRMKFSICEAKIMNSFGDFFFKNLKS
jgi:hypothetical protein